MDESEDNEHKVPICEIKLELYLNDSGMIVLAYEEISANDSELSLVEILGALELAKDTAIRSRMDNDN